MQQKSLQLETLKIHFNQITTIMNTLGNCNNKLSNKLAIKHPVISPVISSIQSHKYFITDVNIPKPKNTVAIIYNVNMFYLQYSFTYSKIIFFDTVFADSFDSFPCNFFTIKINVEWKIFLSRR